MTLSRGQTNQKRILWKDEFWQGDSGRSCISSDMRTHEEYFKFLRPESLDRLNMH